MRGPQELKRVEFTLGIGPDFMLHLPSGRYIRGVWISVPPPDIASVQLYASGSMVLVTMTGAELDWKIWGSRLYSSLPIPGDRERGITTSFDRGPSYQLAFTAFAPARMIAIFDMWSDPAP